MRVERRKFLDVTILGLTGDLGVGDSSEEAGLGSWSLGFGRVRVAGGQSRGLQTLYATPMGFEDRS